MSANKNRAISQTAHRMELRTFMANDIRTCIDSSLIYV